MPDEVFTGELKFTAADEVFTDELKFTTAADEVFTDGYSADGIEIELVPDRAAMEMLVQVRDSAPAARRVYQLYLNGRFNQSSVFPGFTIPWPVDGTKVVVFAVDVANSERAASPVELPGSAGAEGEVAIAWRDWRRDGLRGWRVYRSATPSGVADRTGVLVDEQVIAAEGSEVAAWDGWGQGGWGDGGWGSDNGLLQATDRPPYRGTWNYGIMSIGDAESLSAPLPLSVALPGPPVPPEVDAQGRRAWIVHSPPDPTMLHWNLSPDDPNHPEYASTR